MLYEGCDKKPNQQRNKCNNPKAETTISKGEEKAINALNEMC